MDTKCDDVRAYWPSMLYGLAWDLLLRLQILWIWLLLLREIRRAGISLKGPDQLLLLSHPVAMLFI